MHFIPTDAALPADALALDNTADVLAQAAQLEGRRVIVLHFPKWTDGRAYSQAVLLRGRLGWRGELRATGDVLVDMLPLLARCGFTAVQLRADQREDAARRALGFFEGHYQTTPAERQAPAAAAAAATAATAATAAAAA
jgi:uncharacterized protein (DUF934 family)